MALVTTFDKNNCETLCQMCFNGSGATIQQKDPPSLDQNPVGQHAILPGRWPCISEPGLKYELVLHLMRVSLDPAAMVMH
jgi:hypothetical protein